MTIAILFAILGLQPAMAQDASCYASLTRDGLSKALDEANTAIRQADIERHQEVIAELEGAVRCLDFVPSPERWADLLIGVAIVAEATEREWEAPLATAIHIHPSVDRLAGGKHPIAQWEPPPRPEPTDAVAPEGVRVFYDGELVSRIPQPGGWHLVQRRDGDGIQSQLLRDRLSPKTGWWPQSAAISHAPSKTTSPDDGSTRGVPHPSRSAAGASQRVVPSSWRRGGPIPVALDTATGAAMPFNSTAPRGSGSNAHFTSSWVVSKIRTASQGHITDLAR